MLDPNFFANARAISMKKHLAQIIGGKVQENEEIIDRIVAILITEADIEKFAKLVGDIYQVSYNKCVMDHRKELERLGIRSMVKAEKGDQSSK